MRWLTAVFAVLLCVPSVRLAAASPSGLSRGAASVPLAATEEEDADLDVDSAVSPAGLARRASGRVARPPSAPNAVRRQRTVPALQRSVSRTVPRPAFREPRHVVPRYGE